MHSEKPLELILASGSPRRKALLESIGLEFSVLKTDTDESLNHNESPQDYVVRLATDKARTAEQLLQAENCAILTADTIVCQDQTVFAKPIDKNDAVRTWQQLSNSSHQVMTSVCLLAQAKLYSCTCTTSVKFCSISSAQMDQYWRTGEPQDKAGAYAIQGFASAWVQQINGSYSNVVGLPLFEVNQLLAKIDLNWL
ncbi:Maf family protein [Arenicella sp.]|nr:Maf family protein [Arenicella sp.]